MRKEITSILTRALPGVLAITVLLGIIGLGFPAATNYALLSMGVLVVFGMTWILCLGSFLPEVVSMHWGRGENPAVTNLVAYWMAVSNPGVHYDTCTGEAIVSPPTPPGPLGEFDSGRRV